MRRQSRPFVVVAVPVAFLVAVATMLAGCGGGGGGGRTETVENGELTIEARDTKFDITRIETPPGPLTVTMVQRGSLVHTFVIDGIEGFKLAVDNRQSGDTGTVELEAGEYEYYCDVPGHRGQGMEGTLVVE